MEAYLQHVVALTVLGAWLGAFVIPLDWDRPWQVRKISSTSRTTSCTMSHTYLALNLLVA